jgi:hypothetical protein
MEAAGACAQTDAPRRNSMAAFRAWLVLILVVVGVYTAIVIRDHGMSLYPQFFGDMTKLAWPGQFNLDFMFMLSLSALWVAWRNRFSASGLALALAAFNLGAPFLAAYLLWLLSQSKGDLRAALLPAEA